MVCQMTRGQENFRIRAALEVAHTPLLLSLMRLLWASLHGGPKEESG